MSDGGDDGESSPTDSDDSRDRGGTPSDAADADGEQEVRDVGIWRWLPGGE